MFTLGDDCYFQPLLGSFLLLPVQSYDPGFKCFKYSKIVAPMVKRCQRLRDLLKSAPVSKAGDDVCSGSLARPPHLLTGECFCLFKSLNHSAVPEP